MNWIGLGSGIAMILFVLWIIIEARKEAKIKNWKNPKKKLF